jgi:hypothetical protein
MMEDVPIKPANQESPESKEGHLSLEVIGKAIAEAKALIEGLPGRIRPASMSAEEFAATPQGKEKLTYHSLFHTEDVMRRSHAVLDACKEIGVPVTDREEDLLKLASAFHDVVQDFTQEKIIEPDQIMGANRVPVANPYAGLTRTFRQRFKGANEENSAKALERFFTEESPGVLTDEDIAMTSSMIGVTFTYFDADLGTEVSRHLHSKKSSSPLLDHIISFADLGAAGMDGPEQYLDEGNKLFREEQLDIQDALHDWQASKEIPDIQKEYFKNRMLKWTVGQATFARGRKDVVEDEISHLIELSPNVKTDTEKQAAFDKLWLILGAGFDASISAAEKKLEERKSMTFEQLVADFGYEIPAK